VVQIDDGVSFGGYQSNITRTVVFGKASARQVKVWNLERKRSPPSISRSRRR